ncbi:tyrosine-protein phosphatase non-receptor type substrate 1-like [Alosa sapidissima]|uniref:tyrosine-protein phosphatase non-receptor type substrate 1-like n=1 Tax=Alosa sapidissima TaxID=34773 RepID=UPI001C07F5B3|nr:tyrosine-protein phosphatase non-receptor type substrate 1-like [Alosa sapidissima]
MAAPGQRVRLRCSIEHKDGNYGVPWSRSSSLQDTRNRRNITLPDPTHKFQRDQDKTSLVITAVEVEDSGFYYCQVKTLSGLDDEEGSGTQLMVHVPPSVPVVLLQVLPAQGSGQWSLLCVTGGFTPAPFSLHWTRTPTGGLTEPVGPDCSWNANEPEVKRSDNISTHSPDRHVPLHLWPSRGQCLRLPDGSVWFRQLVSVLQLPPRESQSDDVIYTCAVSGHPALTAALSTSFTWEARPDMIIGHLNVLKMAILSGMLLVLMVSGMGCMCINKRKTDQPLHNDITHREHGERRRL